MLFEVHINGDIQRFEQYQDALRRIDAAMAYWNNFEPHLDLNIAVRKIPDGSDTLEVSVSDAAGVQDKFGG